MVDAAKGMLDAIEEDGGEDLDAVETPGVDKMVSTEREPRLLDDAEDDGEGDDGEDEGDDGAAEAAASDEAEKDETPSPAASPERPPGFVPEAALAETRNELRESRRTQRQLEATLQRWLDTQTQQAEKAAQPAPEAAEEDEMPGEDDPLGQIAWLRNEVATLRQARATEAESRQKQEAEERQRYEQRQQWDGAVRAVKSYWSNKVAEQPDLGPIWDALRINRAQEFVEVNGVQDQNQLVAMVTDWENQIIADCFNNQKPIDQVIRKLAKVRNVTPAQMQQAKDEAKEKEAKPAQERDEQGRFKAEQDKAARIKEGQERNGSLSQASGTPVEKMSAREFAKLSEEEQHRVLAKMSGTKGYRDFEREMGYA